MGVLSGKVAIVTGAGRGIGREIALLFAQEGAKVVVNDLGVETDGTGTSRIADEVVAEIQKAGGEAAANYDSVATAEGGQRLFQTAIDRFGALDILVNNAGILRDKTLYNMEEGDWDAVIAVHLRATTAARPFAATSRTPIGSTAASSISGRCRGCSATSARRTTARRRRASRASAASSRRSSRSTAAPSTRSRRAPRRA